MARTQSGWNKFRQLCAFQGYPLRLKGMVYCSYAISCLLIIIINKCYSLRKIIIIISVIRKKSAGQYLHDFRHTHNALIGIVHYSIRRGSIIQIKTPLGADCNN